MRRRLRLLALAISAISIAAFLVPLVLALRQHQRTTALSAASQTATGVASVASVLGDDQTRLQNYFRSAYGGTPYDITVWYRDGRSVVLAPQGAQPGTMPAELRSGGFDAVGGLYVRSAAAGGYRFLASGLPGPAPVRVGASESTPVVEVFVPTSELDRGMQRNYVNVGIVALVIVLASVVVADRVAGMRPPSAPTTPVPSREPAPV